VCKADLSRLSTNPVQPALTHTPSSLLCSLLPPKLTAVLKALAAAGALVFCFLFSVFSCLVCMFYIYTSLYSTLFESLDCCRVVQQSDTVVRYSRRCPARRGPNGNKSKIYHTKNSEEKRDTTIILIFVNFHYST
jgi:hypothetical protein